MKKLISLLLFAFVVILAVSCTSNEKRAEKLIKDYMFKNLHDYSSYEPVETKVDTAYNSLFYSDSAMLYVAAFMDAFEAEHDYMDDFDSAMQSVDIWSGPYMTSYSRKQLKEAGEKVAQSAEQAANEAEKAYKYAAKVNNISKTIDTTQVFGWKVSHKFRSNNRAGNKSLGQYLFIIDKDFKGIIQNYDMEDDVLVEAEDVLESLKDDDNIITFKNTAEKLRSVADLAAKKFK